MSLRIVILFLVLGFANALLPSGQSWPLVIANSGTTDNSIWSRVYAGNEEFSVLMPGEPSVYFNSITNDSGTKTFERIYSSYAKGSAYLVVSYDRSSIRGTLENFKAHHLYQGEVSYAFDIGLASYSGKQYKLKFGEAVGTLQIYATKKHGYALATIQAVPDPPLANYFLSSFSLASDSKTATTGTQALPRNQASDLPQASEFLSSEKKAYRRPVVVSKPEPWYDEEAKQSGVTGTVVLRAVLASSGEVTNIHTIRGLPKGLTEKAITAARHIKFIPAINDGKFVSYRMELQYNFGLF